MLHRLFLLPSFSHDALNGLDILSRWDRPSSIALDAFCFLLKYVVLFLCNPNLSKILSSSASFFTSNATAMPRWPPNSKLCLQKQLTISREDIYIYAYVFLNYMYVCIYILNRYTNIYIIYI